MLIDDLATPTLLVERQRLAANLAAMQALANLSGVALRPHVKTHKSVAIARMQTEGGAHGLTAAKPSEAAVFIDAGLADVFVAYPAAGAARLVEVRTLALRAEAAGGRLTVGVDTARGADALSAVMADAGRGTTCPALDVRVEIDTGQGRCGVDATDLGAVAALVRHVAALPGLRLAGLYTHEGHAYAGPAEGDATPTDARRRVMRDAQARLLAAADAAFDALDGTGSVAPPDALAISMGSTPTASVFEPLKSPGGRRVTELRPGNYVFRDAQQVALGASLDTCALTALATVVSRHTRPLGQERVFLDAGRKVLTGDLGYGRHEYGLPLYNARTMREHPHLRLDGLSEEHLWVDVRGHATLDVGDRVRLVPNHACVAVATQDRLVLVDGDEVVGEIAVDARGAVR